VPKSHARKRRNEATGQVGIDLAKLRQPKVIGFADKCALIDGRQWWELMFLDDRAALSSPLVIARLVLMADDLVQRIWPTTSAFLEDAEASLRASGLVFPSLQSGPPPSAIVSSAAAQCTLFGISRSGLSAQLDAYFVSPRSAHFARTEGRKLEVLPVLAVQLPIALLVSILRRIRDDRSNLETIARQGGVQVPEQTGSP